eukprot:g16778.t1
MPKVAKQTHPASQSGEDEVEGEGGPAAEPHPYGVQPEGNMYLDPDNAGHAVRTRGLGHMSVLKDDTILSLLKMLEPRDLCRLCAASRALYAFSHEEEVWRDVVLGLWEGDWWYWGTWRETALRKLGAVRPDVDEVAMGTDRAAQFATEDENETAGKGQERKPPNKSRKHVPLRIKGFYSDALHLAWLSACAQIEPEWLAVDNIPRRANLSPEEFVREFEAPNRPVVLTDQVTSWPAFTQQRWSLSSLLAKYRKVPFLCGGTLVPFSKYVRYAQSTLDGSPLYLFDKTFGEHSPALLADYAVPRYFQQDYFDVLHGQPERPRFRWFLVGPKGSGSSFHKDPNITSAWNGLVVGRKKWIMFPPDVVPPGCFPSPDNEDVTTPLSLYEWFHNFYSTRNDVMPLGRVCYECIQKPGEMVFIPTGWWHMAINLEMSVAVTQNFVSPRNLTKILDFLAHSKVDKTLQLGKAFRAAMEKAYPKEMAAAAEAEQRKRKKRERRMEMEKGSSVSEAKKPKRAMQAQEQGGGAQKRRRLDEGDSEDRTASGYEQQQPAAKRSAAAATEGEEESQPAESRSDAPFCISDLWSK